MTGVLCTTNSSTLASIKHKIISSKASLWSNDHLAWSRLMYTTKLSTIMPFFFLHTIKAFKLPDKEICFKNNNQYKIWMPVYSGKMFTPETTSIHLCLSMECKQQKSKIKYQTANQSYHPSSGKHRHCSSNKRICARLPKPYVAHQQTLMPEFLCLMCVPCKHLNQFALCF